MLYFWLRSDDLAEDHTSVDMLSVPVGPVDVLPPDVPVLVLAAVGPTGIVAPGGGAGVRAPAVAAAAIGDGAVAIGVAAALRTAVEPYTALQNLTASLIQMRAHTPATMTATSATEDRLILVELDCTGFTVTVNCQ